MHLKHYFVALLSTILALAGGLAAAPSANADSQFQIAWTGVGIYPRVAPSMSADVAGDAVPDGATISVSCEVEGEPVSNGAAESAIWERLPDGSYIPNSFVNTGADGWTPGVPTCLANMKSDARNSSHFDRDAAANWTVDNVDSLPTYDEDCTYFITQAFVVGGVPEADEWHLDDMSAPRAASVADDFVKYMTNHSFASEQELNWSQNEVPSAQRGDVIAYDWNSDGVIDHLAMITSFAGEYPLVTQHSSAARDRGWTWSDQAQQWLEALTIELYGKPGRVYLLHILY